MSKKVIIIPAKEEMVPTDVFNYQKGIKKRVAAYCRVSTLNEDQTGSYINQVEEWTRRILENNDYDLVKIYGDEGISGTSSAKRASFLQMMKDARDGKIDLILVKSISRFGRNVVETISNINELKKSGTEVYFDSEQMSSFDAKCEMILAILSSIAQEEARHISDNVNWAMTKKMRNGEALITPSLFMGYEYDKEHKKLKVNEEQAKIVRFVFEKYASGTGLSRIAKILEKNGIKTIKGRTKWSVSTLRGMIRNEKYKGDLLQPKSYTVSYLTHKVAKNNGQRQQYLVENNHEAIVSKELWDRCNLMMTAVGARQRGLDIDNTKYASRFSFAGVINCVHCGRTYKRRQYIQGYKVPKIFYQCGGFVDGECKGKALNKDLVYLATTKAINYIYHDVNPVFDEIKNELLFKYSNAHYSGEIKRLEKALEPLKEQAYQLRLERDISYGKIRIQKKLDAVAKEYNNIWSRIKLLKKNRVLHTANTEQESLMLEILLGKEMLVDYIEKVPIRLLFYKMIAATSEKATHLYMFLNKTDTFTRQDVKLYRNKLIQRKPVYSEEVSFRDSIKTFRLTYHIIII